MARRPLGRLLLLFVLAAPSAVLACVGDAPAVLEKDAAVDPTDAGSDAVTNDAVATDAVANDASVDAGPCSNAVPGNSISLPTSGSVLNPPSGGPLLAGDYVLTQVNAMCLPCTLKGGAAAAGLHVTVSGANVTIERRMDYQITGQPAVQVLDRWTGTYDQLNAKMPVATECPKIGTNATWAAYLPVGADGGASTLVVRFDGEFRGQRTDGGADAGPEYIFTFLKK